MSVMRLGSPAIPVKLTEYGTQFAKLSHIWLAARRYAKQTTLSDTTNLGHDLGKGVHDAVIGQLAIRASLLLLDARLDEVEG